MNGKDLLCAMGHVEDRLVDEAAKPVRSGKLLWLRPVAVAACVCLVLAGVLTMPGVRSALDMNAANEAAVQDKTLWWEPDAIPREEHDFAAEPESPEIGKDPMEELRTENQVQEDGLLRPETALRIPENSMEIRDMQALSFEEACALEILGGYVPQTMPEKYTWGSAALYRMERADGQVQRILTLSYYVFFSGTSFQGGETTGGMMPFTLYILDFQPDTDFPIYDRGQVPADAEGFFYICYGDAWIGLSLAAEDRDALLSAIGG